MRAIVIEIALGSQFTDGEQRVTLKVEDADWHIDKLRFPLSKLGLNGLGSGPFLGQEVEVTLAVPKGGRK